MHLLRRPFRSLCAAGALALLGACSLTAPRYQPTTASLTLLDTAAGGAVALGAVAASPAAGGRRLDLHSIEMKAPEGDYAAYLRQALAADLSAAGLLDPAAPALVSATLLRNEISAVRMETHRGAIEARFVVARNGKIVFDKLKRATVSWDTHLVGAMDSFTARKRYPQLVAAMLGELYGDPDFVKAIAR